MEYTAIWGLPVGGKPKNKFEEIFGSSTRSFYNPVFYKTDRFIVTKDISVLKYTVSDNKIADNIYPSDHLPIVIDILFK